MLVLCGPRRKTQTQLGVLRIEMGNRLGLRDPHVFAPLWVVDFPLLEWSEEDGRFYAMHHPFTAPKPEHEKLFYSDRKEDLEQVCANAYDFVLNGTELGGGSIRIHDAAMQSRMFEVLGISKEDAEYKFGFIINAFKYGAPLTEASPSVSTASALCSAGRRPYATTSPSPRTTRDAT